MKQCSQMVISALLLLGSVVTPARAQDTKELKDWAKQNLIDKGVVIRHFYAGNKLEYDGTGNLIQGGTPGEPDLDGPLYIDDVKLTGDGIVILGTRQCGTWKGNVYETVRLKGNNVRIHVATNPGTVAELSALIRKIFYADRAERDSDLSTYWQTLGDRLAPPYLDSASGPAEKVGGKVKAPRVRLDPDPSYDEEARRAKVQGVVVLWLVVDQNGDPRSLRVARHFGCGLDEKALATVAKWKFDPATRDGQPVPVQVNVEINFRLW